MNRGHIKAHGPGKWRIYVYAGVDEVTGKPRQKTKVVTGTEKDAQKALTKLLGEVDAGRHRGTGGRTFGQVLEAFIVHKSLSNAATTMDTYRRQLVYIPERLAKMPVDKVDVAHLEALYAMLATKGNKRTERGLTPKSVKNVHGVIYGALELARRRKWIVANPAADAELPAGLRREPTPAPAAALARLFAAAADQHKHLPLYLRVSLVLGARRSEVHGLRWSGVDFKRNRITVRDTIVFAAGEWQVKPRTKTGTHRVIVIDPATIDQLRGLQAEALDLALEFGTSLSPNAFVFSDAVDGSAPWNPTTTARRFSRACVAVGLPKGTRLHDLRHLAATYLIDVGLPIPAVSARLGHSQSSITLDVYGGRVPQTDELAAEAMGRLLDGDV